MTTNRVHTSHSSHSSHPSAADQSHRSRNTSNPAKTKKSDTLSTAWRTEKLRNLAVKIGSGSTPRGGEAVYTESGIPLIRSMNVHFSGFKPDGLAFIDESEVKKLNHVKVEPN